MRFQKNLATLRKIQRKIEKSISASTTLVDYIHLLFRAVRRPQSNPYFRANPKLFVFENGQFSGRFFLS